MALENKADCIKTCPAALVIYPMEIVGAIHESPAALRYPLCRFAPTGWARGVCGFCPSGHGGSKPPPYG